MTPPESQSRFKQLLIMEGSRCWDQGGAAKKQECSLGGRVLVSPPGIHIIVSQSSSADLKPPINERCYLLLEPFFIPERRRTTTTSPGAPKHQIWRAPACTYPDPYLWPYFPLPNYKTISHSLPKEDTVFKALACYGLLCLGKAMKTIFFFFPSPKTLSLSFYSTSVDRGQVSATQWQNGINVTRELDRKYMKHWEGHNLLSLGQQIRKS